MEWNRWQKDVVGHESCKGTDGEMKWMCNTLTGGKTETLAFLMDSCLLKKRVKSGDGWGVGGWWWGGFSDIVENKVRIRLCWVHSRDGVSIAPSKRFHLDCYVTGSMLEAQFSPGYQARRSTGRCELLLLLFFFIIDFFWGGRCL